MSDKEINTDSKGETSARVGGQSPQAIRHGNKDVFDLGPGEVLRNSAEPDEVPEFSPARDEGI